MASEQDKIAHRLRLWALTSMGMGIGVWDMVQESSVSLSPTIGAATLTELEKQLGLEIAGEKPEDILTELGRIFVDEYGYASEAKLERTGNTLKITPSRCALLRGPTGIRPFCASRIFQIR